MEKWLSTLAIIVLIKSARSVEEGTCSCGRSASGGEQVICQNVTATFFKSVDLNLTRSHWLTCENCVLTTIAQDTFPFKRNNISNLNLNDTKIEYLGDYAFVQLPLVKTLNLSANLIDTIKHRAFAGLKRLLRLNLSRNKLRRINTNMFGDLENLDILDLKWNEIEFIEDNGFAGLVNLQYLYLRNNKLVYLQENTFRPLFRLKILNLNNNLLTGFHQSAFNNLRNLNHLYINNNSINFLVQYSFKELTSLLELQMRKNQLSEIEASSFNGLRKIKYLYLGENNISFVKQYGFVGLNSLLILDLMSNNFHNFSLDYLNGMEYLTSVWLQNNSISNFQITKQSDTFNAMRVLDLNDNQLEHINFKYLHSKLPKVHQLFVGNNSWKCEVILEMYEYYRSLNVSVCLDESCKQEHMESYIDGICGNLTQTENPILEFDGDYVMSSVNSNSFTHGVFYILLFITAFVLY